MDYNFNLFYRRWALLVSIINIIGLLLSFFLELKIVWLIGIVACFAFFLSRMTLFLKKMPLLIGYANWVSIIRLVTIIIVFIFYESIDEQVLFYIFLVAILLDGLDGFLARKFGHVSQFGGVLDMETDALLVLILSWIHVDMQSIGWWLLIPGGFRYIYGLLFSWFEQNPMVDFPPKIVRATIAVIFFFSLLTPFVLSQELSTLILSIASVLIILSFSLSIISNLIYD